MKEEKRDEIESYSQAICQPMCQLWVAYSSLVSTLYISDPTAHPADYGGGNALFVNVDLSQNDVRSKCLGYTILFDPSLDHPT